MPPGLFVGKMLFLVISFLNNFFLVIFFLHVIIIIMKIKMLNTDTINKIAAGEVIIRPVSVIKELVENAIDSGATRITVIIEAGGKDKMIVRDNGSGIAYNEVPLAFKRYATSKLTSIEDLESIESLGFRGEALSSVSAVARVQVTTCNEGEEIGSLTLFEGGTLVNQRVCSYGRGTEMKVWDLFYNTPARRKHLEKDKKEETLIRDLLEKLALSNPGIAFQVKCNGRNVFSTPGSGKVLDVVSTLYGWEVASRLIPIQFENSPMKLKGFIGDLTTMRSHREDQIFFINGRYIKNPALAKALDSAYEGYTMNRQHPLGIIFMELPGRMLDINIHPAKTLIKILNESLITLLFRQGIRETLSKANLVIDIGGKTDLSPKQKDPEMPMKDKKMERSDEAQTNPSIPKQQFMIEGYPTPDTQSKQKNRILLGDEKDKPVQGLVKGKKACVDDLFLDTSVPEKKVSDQIAEVKGSFVLNDATPSSEIGVTCPDFTVMKIIGQLFNTYILLQGMEEIYLIDQHAAHEAFLTRELAGVFDRGEIIPSQGLMAPIPIKIRPKDMDRVVKNLAIYKKIGYECDVFGEDSLIIRSVPLLMGEPQNSQWLMSLINEDLSEMKEAGLQGQWLYTSKVKEKIISMACKAAIKGGQILTNPEIKGLLEKLMSLDNPFTCPHGRPIITRLREYELMKLFKRVV